MKGSSQESNFSCLTEVKYLQEVNYYRQFKIFPALNYPTCSAFSILNSLGNDCVCVLYITEQLSLFHNRTELAFYDTAR